MTTQEQPEDRWQTIKAIWAKDENRWLYVIVGLVVGFLLGFTIRDFALDDPGWHNTIVSLFPEVFGITITILVLNTLADRRVLLEKKRDLIFKMGSSRVEIAVPAVEDLRRYEWLTNGSLQKARLSGANLQEADLHQANLMEAILNDANLQDTNLEYANLQKARLLGEVNLQNAWLSRTQLQGALLSGADLQGATFWQTNLQGASLVRAKLQGAKLNGANLQGANLEGAEFDKIPYCQISLTGHPIRTCADSLIPCIPTICHSRIGHNNLLGSPTSPPSLRGRSPGATLISVPPGRSRRPDGGHP